MLKFKAELVRNDDMLLISSHAEWTKSYYCMTSPVSNDCKKINISVYFSI